MFNNRSPEAIRDELLAHVEFEVPRPPQLEWDPEMGFLIDPAKSDDTMVRVAGFATPYKPRTTVAEYDDRPEIYPTGQYRELPHSLRKIKHQSWGVGSRLFTDEQTARDGSNVQHDPRALVGLYRFDVERNSIMDIRDRQGGPLRHIARYAVKRLASIVIGTEATVGFVHDTYGNNDAIRMRRPEQGKQSMRRAGMTVPEGAEPGFLLLRHRSSYLTRLGHVVSGDWL